MTYDTISSKVVIARVFDAYNIDYSGFISRVPNWIHQAVNEIDMPQSLVDARVEATVVDYKALIPAETKELVAVEYEGFRLRRINAINTKYTDTTGNIVHIYEKYEIDNGYVITSFEEGDIVFYIKKLPVEFDTTLKLYFPIIKNDEELLLALDNYVIKRLLQRGHKVVGYSLSDNNEFTNPALAWSIAKRKARNSLLNIDSDMREELSKLTRSFLSNYNYANNEEFNPNYIPS